MAKVQSEPRQDKSRPKGRYATTHQPPSGFLRRLTVMSRPSSPFRAACYPETHSPPMKSSASAGPKFQRLVEIMARLRGPGRLSVGSRADLRLHQALHAGRDLRSARRHRPARLGRSLPRNWATSCCRPSSTRKWPSKKKLFDIGDALDAINEKLVRRHPHVFADEIGRDRERRQAQLGRDQSGREEIEGGSPKTACWLAFRARCPALVEAQQITSRAAGAGFDWENPEQVIEKLHEELAEFAEARRNGVARLSSKTNWAICCSCW